MSELSNNEGCRPRPLRAFLAQRREASAAREAAANTPEAILWRAMSHALTLASRRPAHWPEMAYMLDMDTVPSISATADYQFRTFSVPSEELGHAPGKRWGFYGTRRYERGWLPRLQFMDEVSDRWYLASYHDDDQTMRVMEIGDGSESPEAFLYMRANNAVFYRQLTDIIVPLEEQEQDRFQTQVFYAIDDIRYM